MISVTTFNMLCLGERGLYFPASEERTPLGNDAFRGNLDPWAQTPRASAS